MDFSKVIPPDAYLTSLTITVNPVGTTPEGQPSSIVGTIAFSGQGASADTVATLLTRLEMDGWVNPFVTTVSRPGTNEVVQFSGTVDLTVDALTERGAGGLAG